MMLSDTALSLWPADLQAFAVFLGVEPFCHSFGCECVLTAGMLVPDNQLFRRLLSKYLIHTPCKMTCQYSVLMGFTSDVFPDSSVSACRASAMGAP